MPIGSAHKLYVPVDGLAQRLTRFAGQILDPDRAQSSGAPKGIQWSLLSVEERDPHRPQDL